MREFSRQREPQLTLAPLQINDLVQQVSEMTRARWSTMPMQQGISIEMRSELALNPPAVMGVESEIREALINLVINAVDAMPLGGTLTVRTRATRSPQPSARTSAHPAPDMVAVEVSISRYFGTQKRLVLTSFSSAQFAQNYPAENSIVSATLFLVSNRRQPQLNPTEVNISDQNESCANF
jgi:hypothetical protein